jgi:hypothetical protein
LTPYLELQRTIYFVGDLAAPRDGKTSGRAAPGVDMPHGQFFDEYLRRQRIALASPDHQEAMAAYREKREPVFST